MEDTEAIEMGIRRIRRFNDKAADLIARGDLDGARVAMHHIQVTSRAVKGLLADLVVPPGETDGQK